MYILLDTGWILQIAWIADIGDLGVLQYGMIIGRDLMKIVGLIINFKHKAIHWDDVTILIHRIKLIKKKELNKKFQLATEPKTVQKAAQRGLLKF